MQFQLAFLCLLAVGVSANNLDVTPVQKVVTLLQGMLEKGKAEKHKEQVAFAKSKQFCEDTGAAKGAAIKEETSMINSLEAKIRKDSVDARHMSKEIGALNQDENTWHGDLKAATKVRSIEKADYEKTHKDYSESIDAIGRAVATLKKQSHDRKQSAASLAQVSTSSLIPEQAREIIDAFVQTGKSDLELNVPPAANGYEFQSSGVIDMLMKLQDKFIDERTTLEQEEANAKHAFDMLGQDLAAQIGQAMKDIGETTVARTKTLQHKSIKTSDDNEELSLRATDRKFLADLNADCKMTESDFENRQQLRTEEIQAIQKAIEIIGGDAVAGNAAKHLPSFLQKKATALGQLRSHLNTQAKIQGRVSQMLHARAEKLNSAVLESVAVRANEDPFSKVKKMIKDLVTRLLEEANEESDHKGWCDTELGTNKQTREEKSSAVETLRADIDMLSASISKISEDVQSLTKAVADLSTAMSTATRIRGEEKAAATETISDAKDAQAALAQALLVLREFYAKASEATSFLQTSAPYTGMGAENGGVVGMLEVIESDFARLESETKAAEATAQKDYDTFMTDSKTDKASKDTAIEHKKAKNQDAQQSLTEKKTDLEGTQKELDAALSYYDKLKPSCVDSGVSYEDRVNRRKEEVESLQEALQVMNGEEIA